MGALKTLGYGDPPEGVLPTGTQAREKYTFVQGDVGSANVTSSRVVTEAQREKLQLESLYLTMSKTSAEGGGFYVSIDRTSSTIRMVLADFSTKWLVSAVQKETFTGFVEIKEQEQKETSQRLVTAMKAKVDKMNVRLADGRLLTSDVLQKLVALDINATSSREAMILFCKNRIQVENHTNQPLVTFTHGDSMALGTTYKRPRIATASGARARGLRVPNLSPAQQPETAPIGVHQANVKGVPCEIFDLYGELPACNVHPEAAASSALKRGLAKRLAFYGFVTANSLVSIMTAHAATQRTISKGALPIVRDCATTFGDLVQQVHLLRSDEAFEFAKSENGIPLCMCTRTADEYRELVGVLPPHARVALEALDTQDSGDVHTNGDTVHG